MKNYQFCQTGRRLVLSVASMLYVLAAPVPMEAVADQARFRIAHSYPQDSQFGRWVEEFTHRVADQASFKFRVYHGGELGSAASLFEAVQSGSIDFALLPAELIATTVPQYGVLSLPGVFFNTESIKRLSKESGLVKALADESKPYNFKPISFGWTFWTVASRDKEILRPSDLRNLRVRTVGQAAKDIVSGVGAKAVSIPYHELFPALQSGAVDAVMTTGNGWNQLVENRSIDNITYSPDYNIATVAYVLAVNLESWQRIDVKRRSIMLDVGIMTGLNFQERIREEETSWLQAARKYGVNVNIMSDNQIGIWNKYYEDEIWMNFVNSVRNGNELIEMAVR